MIERLKEAIPVGLFNAFVPEPPIDENDEAIPPRWQQWRISNWGCKNEPDGKEVDVEQFAPGITELRFATPWGAPVPFYEKLTEMGFLVVAFWAEMGNRFCGAFFNGDREDYDVPFTLAEAKATIPDEIDELFGITNFVADETGESLSDAEPTVRHGSSRGRKHRARKTRARLARAARARAKRKVVAFRRRSHRNRTRR